MRNTRHLLGRLLAGGALLLALSVSSPAAGAGQELLTPEKGQGRVARSILAVLEHEHYGDVAVDDRFSGGVLERYLDALDPFRSSLLAADVEEFRTRFGTHLDDALLSGDMGPAFEIFNRVQAGLQDEIEYEQKALAEDLEGLRFDVKESLELDRSEMPWPATRAERRDLWRKRFKNDVLVLRLDGKSAEEIRTTLERRYRNQALRVAETNSGDVFNLFINVVTGGFDPHTNYFPPRDAERFDMMMSLSFQGIGAQLTSDGEFAKVVRLIPGGPAEKSGEVQPADRIVAVGQGESGELEDVIGWRLDDIVELIRGPKGTAVRLGLRAAEAVDGARVITLVRDEVKLEEQAARSEVLELERAGRTFKVGVIELPAFYVDFEAAYAGDPNFRSSTRDVAKLIGELEQAGVSGIVLDLRGNGGGSLNEAQSLSGLFLGHGPVVQVRDEDGHVQVLDTEQRALWRGPLVVMVDRLSASASEILAAAVQDRGRGLIVGSQTFGKGTVQSIHPLGEGQIKLTQAKFYRVTGASTQERGVTPDILFPSQYDPEEVGESALPQALPWDRIRGVLRPVGWEPTRLAALRAKHEARAATDPGFLEEEKGAKLMEAMRSRTAVSLEESERRAEIERDEALFLELANARRRARGLEAVEDLDDLGSEDFRPELDVFATEAARILLDWDSSSRVVVR